MQINYVPWDIEYLKLLFTLCKNNIGVAVLTGLSILATITGVVLIIRLAWRFTRWG